MTALLLHVLGTQSPQSGMSVTLFLLVWLLQWMGIGAIGLSLALLVLMPIQFRYTLTRPMCRRCRSIVHEVPTPLASPGDAVVRCSECGSSLNAPNAILYARPRLLARATPIVLLLGIVGPIVLLRGTFSRASAQLEKLVQEAEGRKTIERARSAGIATGPSSRRELAIKTEELAAAVATLDSDASLNRIGLYFQQWRKWQTNPPLTAPMTASLLNLADTLGRAGATPRVTPTSGWWTSPAHTLSLRSDLLALAIYARLAEADKLPLAEARRLAELLPLRSVEAQVTIPSTVRPGALVGIELSPPFPFDESWASFGSIELAGEPVELPETPTLNRRGDEVLLFTAPTVPGSYQIDITWTSGVALSRAQSRSEDSQRRSDASLLLRRGVNAGQCRIILTVDDAPEVLVPTTDPDKQPLRGRNARVAMDLIRPRFPANAQAQSSSHGERVLVYSWVNPGAGTALSGTISVDIGGTWHPLIETDRTLSFNSRPILISMPPEFLSPTQRAETDQAQAPSPWPRRLRLRFEPFATPPVLPPMVAGQTAPEGRSLRWYWSEPFTIEVELTLERGSSASYALAPELPASP